jgi:GNAT superfamily N-acetyltransferase
MDESRVAAVCDTAWSYLETGNEVFDLDGCTFVRNRACPRRWDANQVTRIRCRKPSEIERLFENAEREYADCDHRRFAVDPLTPPEVGARLALAGYPYVETVWMGLDGDLRGAAPDVDIRLLRTDEGWRAATPLIEAEWEEALVKQGRAPDSSVVPEFVATKRAKSPTIRHWLAYVGANPCAYFSSWEGKNGVGIVEDLFTLPRYRHRGIATALLHHCVADARSRGAASVIIGALTDDTPKQMYAAMGFRPLLTTRHYTRTL